MTHSPWTGDCPQESPVLNRGTLSEPHPARRGEPAWGQRCPWPSLVGLASLRFGILASQPSCRHYLCAPAGIKAILPGRAGTAAVTHHQRAASEQGAPSRTLPRVCSTALSNAVPAPD